MGGKNPPTELLVWTLAERFGWTLEYIEGLPITRIHELIQVDEGRNKAMEFMQK